MSIDDQTPNPGNDEQENDGIQNAMLTYMKVLHGHSERSDEELEVNVLVPQNNAQLSDFVRLQNRQSGARGEQ